MIGIDVPTIGEICFEHHQNKYLLEMKYRRFSWVMFNWDIYQHLIYG